MQILGREDGVARTNDGRDPQIGSTPLVTRELHFAVARRRADAESSVARFNAALRE